VRIVENSPSYLRLRETSGILPAILFGCAALIVVVVIAERADLRQLISAALFAASAVFFRRIARIELDKSGRVARISRVDMWRPSERLIGFDDISDVQVEVMRPDTSVQPHTRLGLATTQGHVPLTAGYSAALDAHLALRETMVDAIFSGRARPARLDAAQVLIDGGRPISAAWRGA
jgi:hypothetical protein